MGEFIQTKQTNKNMAGYSTLKFKSTKCNTGSAVAEYGSTHVKAVNKLMQQTHTETVTQKLYGSMSMNDYHTSAYSVTLHKHNTYQLTFSS